MGLALTAPRRASLHKFVLQRGHRVIQHLLFHHIHSAELFQAKGKTNSRRRLPHGRLGSGPVNLTPTEISNGATGKWVLDGQAGFQYGDVGRSFQTAGVCNGNFNPQSASTGHVTGNTSMSPVQAVTFNNDFYDISSSTNPPTQPSLYDLGGSTVFSGVAGTIATTGGVSTFTFTSPASMALFAQEKSPALALPVAR